jgi:hypothetical protein
MGKCGDTISAKSLFESSIVDCGRVSAVFVSGELGVLGYIGARAR